MGGHGEASGRQRNTCACALETDVCPGESYWDPSGRIFIYVVSKDFCDLNRPAKARSTHIAGMAVFSLGLLSGWLCNCGGHGVQAVVSVDLAVPWTG